MHHFHLKHYVTLSDTSKLPSLMNMSLHSLSPHSTQQQEAEFNLITSIHARHLETEHTCVREFAVA